MTTEQRNSRDITLLVVGGIIGVVFSMILGNPKTPITLLPVLVSILLAWGFLLVPLFTRILSRRMARVADGVSLLLLVAIPLGFYAARSPYIFGSKRLRGELISGVAVPSSDFAWSTNGSVIATPITESGKHAMKVEMTLRRDKPCADAGWGIELLRWDWLLFTTTYDSSLASKQGVRFYIRGEKGGENIGISLKSDRETPSPSGAASDEEKVSLSSLGVTITQAWQQVSVSFARFDNFDKRRARNLAFYSDIGMRTFSDSQVFYIKQIEFWGAPAK